jgi:hypothetical protein
MNTWSRRRVCDGHNIEWPSHNCTRPKTDNLHALWFLFSKPCWARQVAALQATVITSNAAFQATLNAILAALQQPAGGVVQGPALANAQVGAFLAANVGGSCLFSQVARPNVYDWGSL